MSDALVFQTGDTVALGTRPEWGSGKVRETQAITHDGSAAQRIRVDFKNAGSKWLNTGVAQIEKRAAAKAKTQNTSPRNTPQEVPVLRVSGDAALNRAEAAATGGENLPQEGWLDQLEEDNPYLDKLKNLSPDLDDILLDPIERLRRTVDAYKYSQASGPLFTWACAQTGLDDPLSVFSRVDLEEAFFSYSRKRDDHLFALVRQLRREENLEPAREIMKSTPHKKARELLQKALR